MYLISLLFSWRHHQTSCVLFWRQKMVCCSNTPYLRVLKLFVNTVVAVYLKRIGLFSSIAKKNLLLGILTIFNIFIVPVALFFPGKFSRQASPNYGMGKPLCSFRNLFHMCIFWLFFATLYHNLKRKKSIRSKGMLGVWHEWDIRYFYNR